MRIIITTIFLLSLGCTSGAQKSRVDVKDGILVSVDGINIAKYQIDIEDIDMDIDSLTKDYLLCLAVDECDENLLKELIDKGAKVNMKCDGDDVITSIAFCKENAVSLAEIMLKNGADINGADQDNDSFLSYAISSDNLELVDFLIKKGADKMQRDSNINMGCLPVHGCKSLKMLKRLEEGGLNINVICENGRNLLHFAAKDNLKDIAQYLVEGNLVDISLKDINGETPLDYAYRFNHPEIAAIIKKKK